jgi:uncharacterized repeat protein (TIGR01451 family)
VGGGSLPNPVKVNGGPTTGGPQVDHTNPSGVGTYLDVANGSNSFYQVFTVPLCPSAPVKTYRLTGWFSTRNNLSGVAGISLRDGVGLAGAIISGSQATVSLPAGNSAFDPWVFASVDGSLTSGQTFSFVVSMDNNVNADDLSLVLLDAPCPPDLSLVKDDGGLNFVAGSTGIYNFTVKNGSVINAPTSGTVTVKDVLPAGLSFQLPLVPAGVNGAAWSCVVSITSNPNDTATCTSTSVIGSAGTSAFSLNVAVASTTASGTTLSNKAKVFGGGDVNKPTETATGLIFSCASDGLGADSPNGGCGFEATLITSAASLVIAKTDSKAVVTNGDTNNYVVTLTNQGPSSANGVVLSDIVGAGLTCPAANAVICSGATGGAVCPGGSLTIANLIGVGITVATLPVTGSLQFTYTCNVN